jgi:hypothetical protein
MTTIESSSDASWGQPLTRYDLLLVIAGAVIISISSYAMKTLPIVAPISLASSVLAYRLSYRCYLVLVWTGALFGIGIGASVYAFVLIPVAGHPLSAVWFQFLVEQTIIGGVIGLIGAVPLMVAAFRRRPPGSGTGAVNRDSVGDRDSDRSPHRLLPLLHDQE